MPLFSGRTNLDILLPPNHEMSFSSPQVSIDLLSHVAVKAGEADEALRLHVKVATGKSMRSLSAPTTLTFHRGTCLEIEESRL